MKKSKYKKREGLFSEVYEVVKKIPSGKVMTYGQIAERVGTRDARKIGWALHGNKDEGVPCHRVVSKEGKLAKNFVFDGPEEQRRRLENEGVTFKHNGAVYLERHLLK